MNVGKRGYSSVKLGNRDKIFSRQEVGINHLFKADLRKKSSLKAGIKGTATFEAGIRGNHLFLAVKRDSSHMN